MARMLLVALLAAAAVASASSLPGYCDANASIPKPDFDGTLKQVLVFIRHGDRTVAYPDACWANDAAVYDCKLTQLQHTSLTDDSTASPAYLFRKQFIPGREVFKGNCGVGQLTSIGHAQQIRNGQRLKAAYSSLLPSNYFNNEASFVLRSDNSPRTVKSGQALFSGMYPPSEELAARDAAGAGDAAAGVPVIPWWTRDEKVDDILPNPNTCPRLAQYIAEGQASAAWKTQQEKVVDPLKQKLTAAAGLTVTDIIHQMDCSMVHLCHGFPLPSGYTPDLVKQTTEAVAWNQNFTYYYPNYELFGRVSMGPLISEALGHMEDMAAGKADTPLFFLYSGHDTGPIMPLLAAYGVYDGVWAPYASLISWELWEKSDGKLAVRFVYNDKLMSVPGCDGTLCDWAAFKSISEGLIPTAADCSETEKLQFGGQSSRQQARETRKSRRRLRRGR